MSSVVMNRQEPGQSDIHRGSGTTTTTFTRQPGSSDTTASNMSGVTLVGLGGSNMGTQNTSNEPVNFFNKSIWGTGSLGFGSSTTKTASSNVPARTGSSALLDNSVSDGWNRNSTSSRILGNPRRTDTQSVSRPQTAVDSLQQNGSSSFFPSSRPPTINLNASSGNQAKPSFGTNFSNNISFSQSEQPPAVYTKFDRPAAPAFQTTTFDAVTRSHQGSANQSPSEERRSFISPTHPPHHSMPGSRNSSLPPSRHGEEIQQQPFEAVGVGRPGPDSYRRQSTPHANVMLGNNDQANRTALQFGQMSFSDHRSSQSFSTNGDFGFSQDSSVSDAMYSRRSSRQVEAMPPPLSNNFTAGYTNIPYGVDQFGGPAPNRVRSDPMYSGRDFEPRTGSIGSSRRDSAQSRDLQLSNGMSVNAATWGQVDQRLRQHQMLQHVDPNFAGFLRMQNSPYIMNLQGMQLPAPYMSHGAMFSVNYGAQREPDPGHAYRSAMLDDFKNNKSTKKHELKDILGKVVEFSGDQHGSRFIQNKLETANSDEKARVFEEILPECHQLMIDVFGNYVIQKFFEHGDQTQKKVLASKMRGRVFSLSLQMYGCRVVQKALEHVLAKERTLLVNELKVDVLKCVKDQNGNHVIQKAIEACPSDMIPFIFDAFKGEVYSLSIHSYGCRVIQRCLEHADADIKRVIMSELSTSLNHLVTDQFGNYVVQHVVLHGEPEDKKLVLDIVSNTFETSSKHKFASNVVEKCLMYGGEDFQREVVRQMIAGQGRSPPQDSMILGLIKDSYGNYVIQKMCEALPLPIYHEFYEYLQPEISKARRMGCGKQVSSIEKKMNRPTSSQTQQTRSNNNSYASRAGSAGLSGGMNISPSSQAGSGYGERTPALTTSNSAQTSSLSSINGDAVEGASNSRKNSVQAGVNHR